MVTAEDSFIREFREFAKQRKIVEKGDKIIVAVSGGLDSMVLLDVLVYLKNEWQLGLTVAHFNHELRGIESIEDEKFVRTISKKYGIDCYVENANTELIAETQKQSIQKVARDLRYQFLVKLKTSLGYNKIATAHHADDNAETILFNILRGTGVQGLSGIPVVRSDISVIRPLLFTTRDRIQDYSSKRKIPYREDSSNKKCDYVRNFIRHTIMPLIRENVNPNITEIMRRTGELFNELGIYIKEQSLKSQIDIIVKRTQNEIILDLEKLQQQPQFIQLDILYNISKNFYPSEIDFNTVNNIRKIFNAETGTYLTINKETVVCKNRNQIIFKRVKKIEPFHYKIEKNKLYEFENFKFETKTVEKAEISNNPYIEYIDADTISNELILRSWKEGDWFIPLGMKDKKKLSDFFIEQKIPLFEKGLIPILTSDENIVWVCGQRLDERFKITKNTKNILRLELFT